MKTFTIVGSTSDIGKVVVEQLEDMGHRRVSRASGISIDNEKALRDAFSRADGAYVMIPFDMKAPDLHKREDEIGEKLSDAIRVSTVKRLVFLSGLSAHLKKRTSGSGAGLMERKLHKLDIEELIFLRCAFFMENFLRGMNFPRQAPSGYFSSAFKGDIPMPMIACKDIGEKVVELLTTANFPRIRTRELLGARDYTMIEATRIMASTIDQPEITYRQVSIEEAQREMMAAGVSPSFADAVAGTAESFNSGDTWALEKRSPENTTRTTLEKWAQEALRTNTRL